MPPFSFFSANQLIFPYAYVALFNDSKSSFYEGPVYSLINWHFLMHMTRHLSIAKVYFMKVSFFVGITHEPFQATAQSTSSPGPSPRSYNMALRRPWGRGCPRPRFSAFSMTYPRRDFTLGPSVVKMAGDRAGETRRLLRQCASSLLSACHRLERVYNYFIANVCQCH